jgi:hypothetical protein
MSKIDDAIMILKEMGLPKAQQNERSAWTLLALLNLRKDSPWSKSEKRIIRIHDILGFIEEQYGKRYAENTRETIRRQTLHQFEQAGLVIRNPDDPTRPTNSPNTVYTVSDEALRTIKTFHTATWKELLRSFVEEKGKLVDKYQKRKARHEISLKIRGAGPIRFSPGKHNQLQVNVIREFQPRFCHESKLVYVGDTARKILHRDGKLLGELGVPITEHEKLPDVVFYDPKKNHLFLIEAVTAHGPISPKRQMELERTLTGCKARKIYVSAFPDFAEFKKHVDNIAWETEIWIATDPDHMIHFNGPKFFNVYK